ncbi:MAG: DNA-binding domain-containing protein [Burkholderiales bacterium]
MTLAAQQRALKRAVMSGDGAGAVNGLLRIYRQAYPARLTAALRDNFGVLPTVLGDEAFDALAQAYIEAHPSRRPSIRWFGDELPGFMAAREDLVPHPALVDLARMEWALRSAFDAADAPSLAADDLAQVPAEQWPALTFTPLPSLQLLPMEWNVEPVWRALQGDDAPDLPEPQALAHDLLIWRQGLETRWRALDATAACWLRCALRGERFADLCALAASEVGDEQAALQAASALRGWIGDGLFRR